MANNSRDYTTGDEEDFLRRLGQHTQHPKKPGGLGLSHRELLERYRTALPLRRDWDRIDAQRIRTLVQTLLAEDAQRARRCTGPAGCLATRKP